MWILLVIGLTSGIATTSVEFGSRIRCLQAEENIAKQQTANNLYIVKTICLEK